MPRASTIAQADIARTLRAFRGLGVAAEVRIYPDGMVIVCEKSKDSDHFADVGNMVRFDTGEDIRL